MPSCDLGKADVTKWCAPVCAAVRSGCTVAQPTFVKGSTQRSKDRQRLGRRRRIVVRFASTLADQRLTQRLFCRRYAGTAVTGGHRLLTDPAMIRLSPKAASRRAERPVCRSVTGARRGCCSDRSCRATGRCRLIAGRTPQHRQIDILQRCGRTPARCMPLSSKSNSPVTVFAPSTSQTIASATSSGEHARCSGTPAS